MGRYSDSLEIEDYEDAKMKILNHLLMKVKKEDIMLF